MRRRARTQVELDFRKALLYGSPFIRLEVTEFANGNRLHRFHFKLGGRDRFHGVVAPAPLWAARISHPIPASGRDDRPQNAPEGRTSVSRPIPCPPKPWDPLGPQTASQRTLARFRAARRPAAAPNGNPRPEQRLSRPSSSHQVELQLDLFPTPVSSPESPTGVFSSEGHCPEGQCPQVAALVTPQLSPMGGTLRPKHGQKTERLDSAPLCLTGETRGGRR